MNEELKIYLTDRVDDQLIYLNSVSIYNQKLYKFLKILAIVCNVLTTMAISITFTVPQEYKVYIGILALVLSTIVLSTYQIEEVQNYGAKWEKFRLAAEQLKSEKYNLIDPNTCIVGETYNNTGDYCDYDEDSCYDCELFSNDLYVEENECENLQLDKSSITILEILSNYVKHLEDNHSNLIKEETT